MPQRVLLDQCPHWLSVGQKVIGLGSGKPSYALTTRNENSVFASVTGWRGTPLRFHGGRRSFGPQIAEAGMGRQHMIRTIERVSPLAGVQACPVDIDGDLLLPDQPLGLLLILRDKSPEADPLYSIMRAGLRDCGIATL